MEDSYKIYPKQFRSSKIPIEKNRCFILMPFDSQFDNIYGNIKNALNDNSYICNRADEITGSKPIMNKILNEILKAHFIIADLTKQNANVFYELGVAHTFKDSQNIILIAQKKEEIPFDITHINRIIYSPDNIKFLTSSILQNLKESKYLYGFYEALQQKNIISIIYSDEEDFVGYLHANLGDSLQIATRVLYGEVLDCNSKEIEIYFDKLIAIIDDTLKRGNPLHLEGVLRVLHESLIVCSNFSITDKIIYDFLYGNLLTPYNIESQEIISHKADLAIALASQRIKINTAMGWIIEYFTQSKSATVDLNRYKVERFLMVTNDSIINNMIVDAIFHKNCYIREHLADIAGEKKLYEAGESLLHQLQVEENYFTIVSIVSALGKLEIDGAAQAIMKMIKEKIEDIIKTNQLFVLKHCKIAISRIDKKYNTSYEIDFDGKYKRYIENYFIL